MKSSIVKIIISLIIAVGAGAGYYVYAQPKGTSVAYVAATDLTKGDKIRPELIREVRIRSENEIPTTNLQNIIGKTVKSNIKDGQWITPSLLTNSEQQDVHYYSLNLPYVEAGGSFLHEGTTVDVWSQADEMTKPKKVLSGVTVYEIDNKDGIASSENVNVVLALSEDQIPIIETAQRQSGVFFVVSGAEIR